MTFGEWLKNSVKFDGGASAGWQRFLLMPVTLVVTVYAAYVGITLFPDGRYPKIVLALPGLIGGGLFHVLAGWLMFTFWIRPSRQAPGETAPLTDATDDA